MNTFGGSAFQQYSDIIFYADLHLSQYLIDIKSHVSRLRLNRPTVQLAFVTLLSVRTDTI